MTRLGTLALLATLGLAGTAACSSAPESAASSSAELRSVSGEVDFAAFAAAGVTLDNPVIIAHSDDDSVYATPVDLDGKWTIQVPVNHDYRFVLANTPSKGTSYSVVSHIMWKSHAKSTWVHCDGGKGSVDAGKVAPPPGSTCKSCGGGGKGGGKGGDKDHDDDKGGKGGDKGGKGGGKTDRGDDGYPQGGKCDDGRDWEDHDDDDHDDDHGGSCKTCPPSGGDAGAGAGGKPGKDEHDTGGKGGDNHDKVCACGEEKEEEKVASECEGKKTDGVGAPKHKDKAKEAEKKMKDRCTAKAPPPAPTPPPAPSPPGGACHTNADCVDTCACAHSTCYEY